MAQASVHTSRPGAVSPVAYGLLHPRPDERVARDRQGRVLLYVEGRHVPALRRAVADVGGVVTAAEPGQVRAAVPAAKIAALGTRPGVAEVRRPLAVVPQGIITKAGIAAARARARRARHPAPGQSLITRSRQGPGRGPAGVMPDVITSEGAAASGADKWIAAGDTGTGVKVGIIDDGFGGLADAQADGELPAGSQITTNSSNCEDPALNDTHGTAVAEVVHAMAPGASLYLACISDAMGFAPAVTWLQGQGVQVIDAGISIPSAGRGDGTGAVGSPAQVVQASSKAGIYWAVAAGNYAQLHFGGTARHESNGFVDFSQNAQENAFSVQANGQATVTLRWDAWPLTPTELDLYIMKNPVPPAGPDDPNIVASSTVPAPSGGGTPVQEAQFTNGTGTAQTYYVYVKNVSAPETMPFDLFVSGAGASSLQYFTSSGSVTEPASSPYVTAVGATQPGSGAVEDYSSRGPSIDGRTKPDITAFDQVSTFTYGFEGFAGTEAAAAHVAGAAALLKSASPQLDPAEIYTILTGRATPVTGGVANTWGAGVLTMGPAGSAPSPATSGYTPLPDPQRVLDTTAAIGGHNGAFNPGEVFTLPLSVPGDTTAVAVTLSATSDSATSVGVFPTNQAEAAGNRATNLRVQPGQVGGSVTAIVPVGPDRAIRIVNGAGHTNIGVDLLGYFNPAGAGTYFPLAQPVRVLDTRGPGNGAPGTQARGHLTHGAVDTVQLTASSSCGQPWPSPCTPAQPLPPNATAAVVNVTATESAGPADLAVYANSRTTPTQALSVGVGERKSNLVIVPLGAGGTIKITDLSAAPVNVLVDVAGWFAPGQGGRYVPLAQATRIVDTATGTGLRQAPLGQGEAHAFDVAGLAGVSTQATAAVLNVTGSGDAQATQLSVSSHDVGFDPVTSIGLGEAQSVAGLAMPPLGATGQVDIRNETGSARIQADVEGYFLGGQPIPAGSGNCVTPMDEAGYASLFDGRLETSLAGWQFTGQGQVDPSTAVVSQNGCDLKTVTGNQDIAWYGAHTYGNDYTLELDWQATTANSAAGVLVDLPNPQLSAATAVANGLSVAIGPSSATGSQQTGSIAGQAPYSVPVHPVGQWNTFRITVLWNVVTVTLNGQFVNRYTITDPSKVNVPGFAGLENSGSNDPVLFRDIRIERNTQALSGSIRASSNIFPQPCLDLVGNNATPGNTFSVDKCNGGMGQNFTFTTDGRIQVANGCLDASSGSVLFEPCNDGTGQQWVAGSEIVNVLTKKCLFYSTTVGLANCGMGQPLVRANSATEGWLLPTPPGGTTASYVTSGNMCLTVQNAVSASGTPVQAQGCNGGIGQQWTAPGDGTLRAVGGCLDLAGGGTAAGTTAQLGTCTAGDAGQQWLPQPDGTMVNPVSGRCLTAPSSGSGTMLVTIADCAGAPLQNWAATAQFAGRGPVNGPAGLCLEVTGGNPSSHAVSLVTCSPAAGTNWTAGPDGTIRAFGDCLDVAGAGTVDNTAVDLAACNGSAAQVWAQRPDGALVNPASDRVLTDPKGAPASGDPVQIYEDLQPFVNVPASNCSPLLTPGHSLSPGQLIASCDGRFSLTLQTDGNLVLYHIGYPSVVPLWSTGTTGRGTTVAVMQTDGNFVLYDGAGHALWASGTGGNPGAFLNMQTDGNLVVYSSAGNPLWSSGTGGHSVFGQRWATSAGP
jgi:hypothetical protein